MILSVYHTGELSINDREAAIGIVNGRRLTVYFPSYGKAIDY